MWANSHFGKHLQKRKIRNLSVCKRLRIRMVDDQGFEPWTPWFNILNEMHSMLNTLFKGLLEFQHFLCRIFSNHFTSEYNFSSFL